MKRIALGFLLGLGTLSAMGATVLYTADPATEDYRGVTILSTTPSGSGGLVLQNNDKLLADRTYQIEDAGNPDANDDAANTGLNGICREGIRWRNTTTGVVSLCIDDTTGAAVWVRIGNGLDSSVQLHKADGTITAYTEGNTDALRGDALEAAVAAMSANETLVIGPGTYAVTSVLTIPAGATIAGSGTNTIVSRAGIVFQLTAADSVNFQNFKVQGQIDLHSSSYAVFRAMYVEGNSQSYCVYLHDASHEVRVFDSWFTAGAADCFRIVGSGIWNCKFQGSRFQNAVAGSGLYLDGTAQTDEGTNQSTIITDCHFDHNYLYGLWADTIHDIMISINQFELNGYDGLVLTRPVEATVIGNFFEYNDQRDYGALCQAIRVVLGDATTYGASIMSLNIANNVFQGEKDCIDVHGDYDMPAQVNITGNMFIWNSILTTSAIRLTNYRENYAIRIAGNMLSGRTVEEGITVSGVAAATEGENLVIANNTIRNFRYAILLDQVNHVIIRDNEISGSTYAVEFTNASSASIINNLTHDNGASEFHSTPSGGTYDVMTNVDADNYRYSIYSDGDAADNATLSNYALCLQNREDDNDQEVGLGFRISAGQTDTLVPGAAITHERVGANSIGSLHFKTSPVSPTLLTRATITKDGDFGIGITAPISKFQVSGAGDTGITISSSDGNEPELRFDQALSTDFKIQLDDGYNPPWMRILSTTDNGTTWAGDPRLTIGNGTSGGPLAGVCVSRTAYEAGANSYYGVVVADAWNHTTAAKSYCAFDALNYSQGVRDVTHVIAFQARPQIQNTGTVGIVTGFGSMGAVATATVTNYYHHYVFDPVLTTGGTVTTQHGIFMHTLDAAGTNYGITIGDTDVDQNLLHVGVTGDPVLIWDESASSFIFVGANLGVSGIDPIVTVSDTSQARTAISRLMSGLELTSSSMDLTNKYGTSLKFMSTDTAFTTENPKFLAGIVPRSTEAYDADTDSGMAIDFFTSPNNAGATNVPVLAFSISENGSLSQLNSTASATGTVALGTSCTADSSYSTVSGGQNNTASTYSHATVGGGQGNVSSGLSSTIPGGEDNASSGSYSLSSGYKAVASLYGQHAQASGKFATAGDAQTSVLTWRCTTTTDNTAVGFRVNGTSLSINVEDEKTYAVTTTFVGRQDTGGWHCMAKRMALVNVTGEVAAQVGATQTIGTDIATDANYTLTLAVYNAAGITSDTITASAKTTTGAAINVRWVARVEMVEVGYAD